MRKHRNSPFFRAMQNYVTFFLLVAFIVSCCMILFVTTLADSMGLVFTKENMTEAAKLTFGCMLLISFGAASIDYVRRKLMVDRPVQQIMDALDQVMQGDLIRFHATEQPISEHMLKQTFPGREKMVQELLAI